MSNKLLTSAEFDEHIRGIGRRITRGDEISYLDALVAGQREHLNQIRGLCEQATCGNHDASDLRWEFAEKILDIIGRSPSNDTDRK
jgi:hypothetical protein